MPYWLNMQKIVYVDFSFITSVRYGQTITPFMVMNGMVKKITEIYDYNGKKLSDKLVSPIFFEEKNINSNHRRVKLIVVRDVQLERKHICYSHLLLKGSPSDCIIRRTWWHTTERMAEVALKYALFPETGQVYMLLLSTKYCQIVFKWLTSSIYCKTSLNI